MSVDTMIDALVAEEDALAKQFLSSPIDALCREFLAKQANLFDLGFKVRDPAGYAELEAECDGLRVRRREAMAESLVVFARWKEVTALISQHRKAA